MITCFIVTTWLSGHFLVTVLDSFFNREIQTRFMSTLVSLSVYYKALSGAQLKVVSLSGPAFLLFLNLGQTWLTSTAAHSDLSKLGTAALKYIYRVEVIRSWSVKNSVPHNTKETSQRLCLCWLNMLEVLGTAIRKLKLAFDGAGSNGSVCFKMISHLDTENWFFPSPEVREEA